MLICCLRGCTGTESIACKCEMPAAAVDLGTQSLSVAWEEKFEGTVFPYGLDLISES